VSSSSDEDCQWNENEDEESSEETGLSMRDEAPSRRSGRVRVSVMYTEEPDEPEAKVQAASGPLALSLSLSLSVSLSLSRISLPPLNKKICDAYPH
jgi:hypothetical protein